MTAAQWGRLALHGTRRGPTLLTGHCCSAQRAFSIAAALKGPKPLPPRPTINEDDITESFLRGTGPGGQKINKTSSAVQLKHLPTGIVVKYQGTRSRSQNRTSARRMLAERLEEMEKGAESRTQIKRAAQAKKKASKTKKSKRKYRALEEAKKAAAGGEEVPEEELDDGEDREWEEIEEEQTKEDNAIDQPKGKPSTP